MLDTLAEIEERGEAVRELEKSLLDLHQIFLDMAVLVEAQGEMLDNIEAQVRELFLDPALNYIRRDIISVPGVVSLGIPPAGWPILIVQNYH